jgi:hypothetical protein
MNFDRAKFYHFCKHLKIETKEQGLRVLGDQLLGTQTYVMDEVARGLAEDKHFFVVSQRQAVRHHNHQPCP